MFVNYKRKALEKMPYAQASVRVYDDGTKVLQSYTTDVIVLTPQGYMYITGLYSATTRRHVSAFMREYTGTDYFTAKRAYNNNEIVNVYTLKSDNINDVAEELLKKYFFDYIG